MKQEPLSLSLTKTIMVVTIFVCLGALVGAIGYLATRSKSEPVVLPPTEEESEIDTSDWQTYRNEEYGFEVKHPNDYILKEVNKDFILMKREKDKEYDWKIEIDIANDSEFYDEKEGRYKSTSNLSFKDFAISEIRKRCAADGPRGSIYCTKVVKVEPFEKNQKLGGYQIYITQVYEIYKPGIKVGEIKKIVKGPIFAIDISQQTNNLVRGIFFEPEESEEKEEFVKVINQMLSTFKFIEPAASQINLSSKDVYFSEEIQGTTSLDLRNAEVEIIEHPYGGAPVVGAKQYSGDAILSFGKSKLNLGKMTFVENTSHDGTLLVKKLNPKNDQDFIIILQYGASSWEMVRFYGYDFMNKSLMQYNFKYKNGKILNEIYVSPTKDNLFEILPSKDFIVKGYDNSIAKHRVTKWRFDDRENVFEEIESWLEEL